MKNDFEWELLGTLANFEIYCFENDVKFNLKNFNNWLKEV